MSCLPYCKGSKTYFINLLFPVIPSFAPAPSTVSCVPLTRNLSTADPSPSPWPGVATPLRGNSMPHCCASALLQCTF